MNHLDERFETLRVPKYNSGLAAGLCKLVATTSLRGVPKLLYATAPKVLGRKMQLFELDDERKLVLDPTDYFQCMMFYRWFAPEIIEICQRFVRQDDIVFDVGAQLGYFSQYMARLVTPRGQVFSFEPDPRAFARLSYALHQTDMFWVKAFPLAVSDRDDTIDFFCFSHTRMVNGSEKFPFEEPVSYRSSVGIIRRVG